MASKYCTLIIRCAIIQAWKKSIAVGVKSLLKNTAHKLRSTKTISAQGIVNISGIPHLKDIGKENLCPCKQGLICRRTTLMLKGVRIQDGRVVRELKKTDISSYGNQSTPTQTIMGMSESIDLLLNKKLEDICSPKRLFII